MIDADKHDARAIVDQLHAVADSMTACSLQNLLREAAVLLDGYQAGINIATPHPATGYALVERAKQPLIDELQHIIDQEAA